MVIPLTLRCILPALYGLLRAPLETGKTLLAFVVPDRFSFTQGDVFGRADFVANPAMIAFLVRPELPVHLGHTVETQFIDSSRQHPLPERAFFNRQGGLFLDPVHDIGNLFLGEFETSILFFLWAWAAERRVVGGQHNAKPRRQRETVFRQELLQLHQRIGDLTSVDGHGEDIVRL